MSKVYNKIVQSNTEPSKNDIWLKDGQMKTFGKEGWKPVSGDNFVGRDNVVNIIHDDFEGEESIKLLYKHIYEAYESNKIIALNNEIISNLHFGSGDGVNFVGFNMGIGGYSIKEPAEFSIGWTQIDVWENGRININYCGNPDEGDGTKFLSDDGSYKPISTSNNEPYIFEYSEDLKDISLDGLIELDEVITSGKKIIIRHNDNDITPMISIPKDGILSGGLELYFISFSIGKGTFLFEVHISSYDCSVSTGKHALNFE